MTNEGLLLTSQDQIEFQIEDLELSTQPEMVEFIFNSIVDPKVSEIERDAALSFVSEQMGNIVLGLKNQDGPFVTEFLLHVFTRFGDQRELSESDELRLTPLFERARSEASTLIKVREYFSRNPAYANYIWYQIESYYIRNHKGEVVTSALTTINHTIDTLTSLDISFDNLLLSDSLTESGQNVMLILIAHLSLLREEYWKGYKSFLRVNGMVFQEFTYLLFALFGIEREVVKDLIKMKENNLFKKTFIQKYENGLIKIRTTVHEEVDPYELRSLTPGSLGHLTWLKYEYRPKDYRQLGFEEIIHLLNSPISMYGPRYIFRENIKKTFTKLCPDHFLKLVQDEMYVIDYINREIRTRLGLG